MCYYYYDDMHAGQILHELSCEMEICGIRGGNYALAQRQGCEWILVGPVIHNVCQWYYRASLQVMKSCTDKVIVQDTPTLLFLFATKLWRCTHLVTRAASLIVGR